MSSIATTMANTLEALMVLLGTFLVAATIMGSFGGLSGIEARLALLQSIIAVVLWTRVFGAPASR